MYVQLCCSLQVLQLTTMPLAVAVVEFSLTMLNAMALSPHSSAVEIVELESTAASMVKMWESDAEVLFDNMLFTLKVNFVTALL